MTGLLTPVDGWDLAGLAVRATIIFIVAFALQGLVRKGAATTRHHLWTLTFALLLALPVVRFVGPSWDVPLLPRAGDARVEPVELPASFVLSPGRTEPPASEPALSGGGAGMLPPRLFVTVSFLVWAVGCGAALLTLGAGALRFRRMVRGAQTVEHQAWLGQLHTVRQQLGIRADVRLVLGPEGVMPMTGGIRRPVILLPASAVNWSEARRHVVLAHELVHVRRRDALRQLVGRIVVAVYWFHPLSWVALQLASARREEACDEEVLAVGTRPSEYAGHLLSLAESGWPRRLALSLLMAQQSHLERRVRAIVRPNRPRPRALVAVVALVATAVGGVSVSIADPTRPGDATSMVGEAAGAVAAAVHCAPASDAAEPPGWDFGQGLDEALVCTIQGATAATASSGLYTIEPAVRAALESELRRQLEGVVDEEATVGSRRK